MVLVWVHLQSLYKPFISFLNLCNTNYTSERKSDQLVYVTLKINLKYWYAKSFGWFFWGRGEKATLRLHRILLLYRSFFIILFSQFRDIFIAEKLLLHSQDVTDNVYPIVKSTNTLGNLFSSHFFTDTASVEGRDSAQNKDHLFFQKSNSWSTISGFGISLR